MPAPEDRFTNTVADAAAYEGWRASGDPELVDEYDDNVFDDYDEEDDDGPCCSDFSCPCGG